MATKEIEIFVDAVQLLAKRIAELEDAIHNLHKVKGRYHTQQACEALFALVGLKNNIGAQND